MKNFNTQAVVLKNIKYRDSDKIFTLFTREHGKISALARGVRKISSRRAGNLDTLNLVSVSIHERSNGFKDIKEVKTLESFKSLKKDLKKSVKAYYLAELIHRAVEENEEVPQIFDLFVNSLKALQKDGYKGDLVISYFEMNLMKLLGFQLTLDKCRKCGRVLDGSWKKYSFNVENGSLECEKCSKFGVTVSKEASMAFSRVFDGKLAKDLEKSAEEIDRILKIYIGRKLESKFKSLEIDIS